VSDTATATAAGPTTLARYIELTARKRDLEKQLRDIKQEIGDDTQGLMARVLAEFAEQGVRQVKHDATGATAYIDRRIWARVHRDGDEATPEEKARAAGMLRAAGMGEFVEPTVAVQRLSAHFRELARERAAAGEPVDVDELLPAELHGAIDLTEDHRVNVRF